jgi:hypothetical protein
LDYDTQNITIYESEGVTSPIVPESSFPTYDSEKNFTVLMNVSNIYQIAFGNILVGDSNNLQANYDILFDTASLMSVVP